MAERMNDPTGTSEPTDWADRPAPISSGAAARADDASAPDPAAIRAEIRETRDRLGETLEEIGDRLNPRHITAQVKDNIRDATIGRVQHMAHSAVDRVSDVRSTMMDTIRENPIPAAMAAVGLGWLFMNARRQGPSYGGPSRDRYDARYSTGASAGYGGETRAYGGYPYGPADAYAPGLYGDTGMHRGRDMAGGMRESAGQVAERAQSAAHDVAHRAQDVASSVAQQAGRQARRAEDAFQANPLAVGAAAVAFGIAAGLSLPTTDREVALMGDARDRLVDRAKDVAAETTEKVQHVATRVMDEARTTTKEAARDEGLTGG